MIAVLVIYFVCVSARAVCLVLQGRTIEFHRFGLSIAQPVPGLLWVSDLSTQRHIIKSSGRGMKRGMKTVQDLNWTQSWMSETTEQGCRTHFHRGPRQPHVAFKGPNVILGLYTCNYSLTVK